MGILHDDLDSLSMAQLEALAGSLRQAEQKKGSREPRDRKKIKPRGQGVKKYQWENLDGVGLNQTIRIEIELPAYFVAAMNGESYRTAVQEYLLKRGKTWWQPRFMAVLKAKQIEAARRRFTSGLG